MPAPGPGPWEAGWKGQGHPQRHWGARWAGRPWCSMLLLGGHHLRLPALQTEGELAAFLIVCTLPRTGISGGLLATERLLPQD